jgi:hypothetical protein
MARVLGASKLLDRPANHRGDRQLVALVTLRFLFVSRRDWHSPSPHTFMIAKGFSKVLVPSHGQSSF